MNAIQDILFLYLELSLFTCQKSIVISKNLSLHSNNLLIMNKIYRIFQ